MGGPRDEEELDWESIRRVSDLVKDEIARRSVEWVGDGEGMVE